MMTTPAAAIKSEIRRLIILHIEVFAALHPSRLLNWKNAAGEPNASDYWGRNSIASACSPLRASTLARHLRI